MHEKSWNERSAVVWTCQNSTLSVTGLNLFYLPQHTDEAAIMPPKKGEEENAPLETLQQSQTFFGVHPDGTVGKLKLHSSSGKIRTRSSVSKALNVNRHTQYDWIKHTHEITAVSSESVSKTKALQGSHDSRIEDALITSILRAVDVLKVVEIVIEDVQRRKALETTNSLSQSLELNLSRPYQTKRRSEPRNRRAARLEGKRA